MNRRKQHTKNQQKAYKCGYFLDIQIIYLDIQVNTEITLPRCNYDSSLITPGPPPVDNFFTLHLTKNIIEHKRCSILEWVVYLSYFRFYE